MSRARASEFDPRGIIGESYHIENISDAEVRTIFLDWAMMDAHQNAARAAQALLDLYENQNPDHAMTALLHEALQSPPAPARRAGRRRKD